MNIADRESEVDSLNNFLDTDQVKPNFRLLISSPRSGLSTVLRYCAKQRMKREISVYVDGGQQNMNAVFSQFALSLHANYPEIWKRFQKFQRTYAGKPLSRDIALAATTSIPYLGSPVVRSLEATSTALPISHYPTAAAELICAFIVSLSSDHGISLFIDDVQQLDRSSRQLLRTTIGRSYRRLRYIAGYVERPSNKNQSLQDFKLEMDELGYSLTIDNFQPPQQDFVERYAIKLGLSISSREAGMIAVASQGDIYRIRAALEANSPGSQGSLTVSPLGRSILGYLVAARQALRESDLNTLITNDESVHLSDDEHWRCELCELESLNLVSKSYLPDGDKLIEPFVGWQFLEEASQSKPTIQLHHQTRLYRYFCKIERWSDRHSKSEILPLLFRLAKIVDPGEIPKWTNQIIRISLQMGAMTLAEEFVERSTTTEDGRLKDKYDFLTRLAFLMSSKSYSKILKLLEETERDEWKQDRLVEVFTAIALNRCREHTKAEKRLGKLCESAKSPEELVLLLSYRIVNLVHSNKVADGHSLFVQFKADVESASNFGYFLRNGAEVVAPEDAIDILEKALEVHQVNDDDFGWATTCCNLGAKLAQSGRAEEGLIKAIKSYERLEVFGVKHLKIAVANIGHSQLYLGHLGAAEESFRRALNLFKGGLPQVYTLLNLSATLALQGKGSEALEVLGPLVDRVATARVDRVRQKTFHNAAVISYWLGSSEDEISALCGLSLRYPDRRDSSFTGRVMRNISKKSFGTVELSDFLTMYSPCSLLYWYQNPLEGLPAYLLSGEASI